MCFPAEVSTIRESSTCGLCCISASEPFFFFIFITRYPLSRHSFGSQISGAANGRHRRKNPQDFPSLIHAHKSPPSHVPKGKAGTSEGPMGRVSTCNYRRWQGRKVRMAAMRDILKRDAQFEYHFVASCFLFRSSDGQTDSQPTIQ